MSNKFHIGENGPMPCSAQPGKCPINPDGSEHYGTMEEAVEAYEIKTKEEEAIRGVGAENPKTEKTPKTKEGEELEKLAEKGLDNLSPYENEKYLTLSSMVDIQEDLALGGPNGEKPEIEDFDKLAEKYANTSLKQGETYAMSADEAETLYEDTKIPYLQHSIERFLDGYGQANITTFEGGNALHFTNTLTGSQDYFYSDRIQDEALHVHYGNTPGGPFVIVREYERNRNTGEFDEVFTADNSGSWTSNFGGEVEGVSNFGYRTIDWKEGEKSLYQETNYSGLLNGTQVEQGKDGSYTSVRAKDGVEVVSGFEEDSNGYITSSRLTRYESDLGWEGEKYTYAPGSDVVLTVENRYGSDGGVDLEDRSEYERVVYYPDRNSDKADRIICRGASPVRIERANGETIDVPPSGYQIRTANGGEKMVVQVLRMSDGEELFKIDATDRLLDAQVSAMEKAHQNRNAKTKEEYQKVLENQYDGVFSKWFRPL